MNDQPDTNRPWYHGISGYQWLVLLIASLGWIFDVFEGQIFVASMNEAMPSLLPEGTDRGTISFYNNIAFGSFLLGGALGGVVFGMLSDRIGRTRTMILTILMYSLFTCVTAAAQTWWQMAGLRFLVAMGVGGEWAVASAMVAEVFPKRARAWSSGIFHASSVFGTYLAVIAGAFVVGNPNLGWRWGFFIGAIPALLTLWIRWKLREPEQWVAARQRAAEDATQQTGRIPELFQGTLLKHTIVGVSLAAIGLATFWGVHIYGKDLLRNQVRAGYFAEQPDEQFAEMLGDRINNAIAGMQSSDADTLQALRASGVVEQIKTEIPQRGFNTVRNEKLATAAADSPSPLAALFTRIEGEINRSIKNWEMLAMFLVTTGGGLGLVLFGPVSERLGRRGAFLAYHIGGLVMALVLFQALPQAEPAVLYVVLPIFGFLTLGMHAGYAVYFPELYPTRLRGTGGGFCFNVGRIIAAPILFLSGWMQRPIEAGGLGHSLELAATILSVLYLLAIAVLVIAPETRGQELPE